MREVAQALARPHVKDIEDELRGVSRIAGLYAAERDQVLLFRAELDQLHLYDDRPEMSITSCVRMVITRWKLQAGRAVNMQMLQQRLYLEVRALDG